MKVLVVHNRYRSALPSGENNVVDAEIELLRSAGVEVHTFFRSSDEIAGVSIRGRVGAGLSALDGRSSRTELRSLLAEVRPDVVHLHNPYPLISPTVITEAREHGAVVVASVHNYRLECMNGLLFRDGAVCTDCADRGASWAGVLHGCYRDSRPQSAVMAVALARHRPTWRGVSRFLAISEFVADRVRRWGAPADRVVVKANATPDPGVPSVQGTGYLYAGRFSAEKGIVMLLDAWQASGLDGHERLVLVGDGPLRGEVERRAAALRSVTVVGPQTLAQVQSWREQTAIGVVPSQWFETLSAAPESFASARPVVASRLGGLGDVVDDEVGWTVEPEVDSLAAALVAAGDPDDRRRKGAAARARFERDHAPPVVLRRQLEVYDAALADPV